MYKERKRFRTRSFLFASTLLNKDKFIMKEILKTFCCFVLIVFERELSSWNTKNKWLVLVFSRIGQTKIGRNMNYFVVV